MIDLGLLLRAFAAALLFVGGAASAQVPSAIDPVSGDYIVAVVNRDVVTASELQQRVAQLRAAAQQGSAGVPSPAQLRSEALESLVEERAFVTFARDSGVRVDDAELDRAVQSIAAQNKWTVEQLRDRLRVEGLDYARFRARLRDQIMVERVREREVGQRIQVSDAEIDAYLAKQKVTKVNEEELNIAHILISVPEDADAQTLLARTERAEAVLKRARGGADFAALAREMSDNDSKDHGGELGLQPVGNLPDVFVARVRDLQPGEVAPALLRTGAGWHVLKLVERKDNVGVQVTQTRVRHILLRPSEQVSLQMARQRLLDYRAQIISGANTFENLARLHSDDGSAAQGGDLGWVSPGSLVPEFEAAMDALGIDGVSQPVETRFGMHLIQVLGRREITLDPKQVRDQARNVLRAQKFEPAYRQWVAELRTRAYVEMRTPPQ